MISTPSPAVWFPTIRAGTGADVFTVRLAESLKKRGVQTEISWLPHRAEYVPFSVAVPKAPDWASIVHVNTWLHNRFVPAHLPLVVTVHHCVHDPAFAKYRTRLQAIYHQGWIKPIERLALKSADAITAVSQYTADRTKEVFGVEGTQVIYNGVDPEEYEEVPNRTMHTPFRLLYVGSWSLRKGVDLLGPIMRELGPEFELWYTSDASGALGKVGLPSNCRSIGRPSKESLLDTYQSCDALLLPTRLEGFGQVAIEAMACGLPVIATRGSALPEVVEEGVTGMLCNQDDPIAFAIAARYLKQESLRWSDISRAAGRTARRDFSIDQMVQGYMEVYSNLLNR